MRRRIVLLLALGLGAGTLLMAGLPFSATTTMDESGWAHVRPQLSAGKVTLRERCGPSVVSAWREPQNEGTWAVTIGTHMEGDSAGSITGLCQDAARRRLGWAAGLGTLAAGTVIIGRRTKPRPSAEGV